MHRKKQNFVEGAFILLAASLIVKIIGALFQIPLTNMVGVTTMGIFSAAYRIYMTMLVISSIGLPAALSKMVAEAATLGKEREVRRIVRIAASVFVPVGAVCTVLLFFGAGFFAEIFANPLAEQAIAAIAPSVLMVSILSVFRGYYQGRANMLPTAVSQIIEALGKLFLGLGFAIFAQHQGMDGASIAAAIVLGITIGEVLAVLFVVTYAAWAKRNRWSAIPPLNDSLRSTSTLLKLLLALAIPITINSAVMSLTDLIDLALVNNRLTGTIGMSLEQATSYYGAYTSMAVNFFSFPQTMVTAISVSTLPAIAAAKASQNFTKITKTINMTFRMAMLITLPAGAGFLLLAGPILRLIYSKDTQLAAPLMQILGIAVPFVAIVAITISILQALGRADLPLYSMFAGGVIKLFINYILLGNPEIHIAGAPISTVVCYATIAGINLIQIARMTHALPPLGKTVGRPLAATIGMGAATYISYTGLCRLLGASIGTSGEKLATVAAILVAVLVYGVLLITLRAVECEDVLMLPKGEKIAAFLHL